MYCPTIRSSPDHINTMCAIYISIIIQDVCYSGELQIVMYIQKLILNVIQLTVLNVVYYTNT
jgi:hypothetical protein